MKDINEIVIIFLVMIIFVPFTGLTCSLHQGNYIKVVLLTACLTALN
jgi:hypothetical protein